MMFKVGAGSHKFELRVSPRCVIHPTPGAGEGYQEELCLIEGYGKTTGLNTQGSPGTILRENLDPNFNEFCQVFADADISPDTENPMFRAAFTLSLDPAICTGKGPERLVEKFDPKFNDDVEEYCNIAYELSSAASGSAREAFGGVNPGKPAHIVLVERSDCQLNVLNSKVSQL